MIISYFHSFLFGIQIVKKNLYKLYVYYWIVKKDNIFKYHHYPKQNTPSKKTKMFFSVDFLSYLPSIKKTSREIIKLVHHFSLPGVTAFFNLWPFKLKHKTMQTFPMCIHLNEV